MSLNRVVVTGRGAVSPFGLGVAAMLDAVWEGRSGVRHMAEWQKIRGLHSHIAAPVPLFDAKNILPRALRRTMGPMALYSTLAAQEATADAGLGSDLLGSGDVGVAVGSTTGSPETYEEFYRKLLIDETVEAVKSGMFFKIMGHNCAANISLALGITGEQWAPSSACTSASQAIGLGYMLIQNGRQQLMLCGGADEVHSTVTMVFDVVKAASRKNDQPGVNPRPFDRDRDGVVCGGGAGILVLENLDSALARNASIYAEILGFGHASDSMHLANPHEESMIRAMRQAMAQAGISAAEVDYVNAHATGTLLGDVAEARAIGAVFPHRPPVSSSKGNLGHTLGAAGSLESILVLEMLARQEVLPTLNLMEPDEQCRGIHLPIRKEKQRLDTVVKNNFALGGVNTALIFRRWNHGS